MNRCGVTVVLVESEDGCRNRCSDLAGELSSLEAGTSWSGALQRNSWSRPDRSGVPA